LNIWEGADVPEEKLLQRYAFKPAPLLLQEIDRIEHLLAQQCLHELHTSDTASTISRGSSMDGGAYKLRLKCLEPGCGSGRNIVWLAARSHSMHITADGSRTSCNDAQHVQQQNEPAHQTSGLAGGVTGVCESVHPSGPSGDRVLSPPCKRQRQEMQHTHPACQQPGNSATDDAAVDREGATQQPLNTQQAVSEESKQLVELDWEVIGVDNW
jgi:hypothetical protein